MSSNKYLKSAKQILSFIPDRLYIQIYYFAKFHKFCNLVNPTNFSEKLQWLKLYDRRPIYTTMVDKYEAKNWVADRIGQAYLVPNLGVWDLFEQIDFDALPEQFVLKCTHDSGGLVICRDRSTFDIQAARRKINNSLSHNYYTTSREWPYRDVEPRILAEVYLPGWTPEDLASTSNFSCSLGPDSRSQTEMPTPIDGVIDYKFYCFHGEPKFLYVSRGLHDHGTARMDFLNLDWTSAEFSRPDFLRFEEIPSMPANFEDMLAIARELSSGIPFVRVDLFEHFGRVIFSEMTFTPAGGMMSFNPKVADFEIGQLLDLSLVEITA